MAFTTHRVTVGSVTASQLNTVPSDLKSGASLMGCNRGSVAVFVGPTGVTSATGFQVDPTQPFSADLDPGENIYAITASSTAEVHILESGV